MTWAFTRNPWLGGEDSNPQRLDQNQLCYRLHHPRMGGPQPYRTARLARTLRSGTGSVVDGRVQAEEAVPADDAPDGYGQCLPDDLAELGGLAEPGLGR